MTYLSIYLSLVVICFVVLVINTNNFNIYLNKLFLMLYLVNILEFRLKVIESNIFVCIVHC